MHKEKGTLSEKKKACGMNRRELFSYAELTYGTKPEYLWASTPDAAVLRHSENKKWYAIVMNIPADRLGLDGKDMVDVVNIKCGAVMTGSLLMCEGIFPAYHMNKERWVSVLLGDSADSEQVKALLQMSYDMTLSPSERSKVRKGPKEWLVPANPKVYDIEKHFAEEGEIFWKQKCKARVGDTVYIYMGAPRSEILCKCSVTETDIPNVNIISDSSVDKVMRLKLVREFDGEFPLSRLREHGVYSVRCARGVPESLSRELEAF